jgi:hypothetical protein
LIKEVSDYLQHLSELHVDIKHAAANVAFCRFQDNQQFAQLTLNASRNIVVIMNFYGRATGQYDDETVKNTIIVRFSCYALKVTSVEITAALEKSMAIMLDFWRRLKRDNEENPCAWMKWIDFEAIQFEEIEQPWVQNHYGWDLIIPYKTHLPPFDQNKWTDTIEA